MYDQPGQTGSAEGVFPKESTLPAPPMVKETTGKGQGVFSSRPLAKGDVAIVGKPISILPERSSRSVQIDAKTHVLMDTPFDFTNHSCEPNCGIRANSHNGYDLIAMRDIAAGEEITWDYCMTEWTCVGFENCHCNSAQCRKTIKGAKFLSLGEFQKYDGYTAPYFLSFLLDRCRRSSS